ncbi:hypothetical protein TVNIR_2827 [Thioalkalivibrio nitratireducens DSM 14787]|uniref:Uncharacterized protein n=1 Tax=Thioalkalivibrio nitratireducens (strain DSM 14787 / UNIQEM 213 / ALEN2) TaxID=1255043 RepID=L0DZT4_THIND|nr:hypothetical protein TVNIR_2827 [Thioalkalivibrio nitratireducens DSM 14787]
MRGAFVPSARLFKGRLHSFGFAAFHRDYRFRGSGHMTPVRLRGSARLPFRIDTAAVAAPAVPLIGRVD